MAAPSEEKQRSVRIESDRFGEVSLPSTCLYGVGTARCLENLSFSRSPLSDYPDFLAALLTVKRACAAANLASGLLTESIHRAIESACINLANHDQRCHFPVDMLHGGGGIAFNVNLNEVIANSANVQFGRLPGEFSPVHPTKHVNLSQSTADVCHTGVRLAIIKASLRLDNALKRLSKTLCLKKVEFLPIKTLARTCLQDALVVPLGETFGAFDAVIERRRKELCNSINKLERVNLGGTVIGSGDGASQTYRAVVIGILSDYSSVSFGTRENLFDAAQNSDDIGNVSAQLRLLAQSLIKICKDLRLLSSGPNGGFGEITLPALQEGSSFFHLKVNPVVPETVIQACMQVLGADTAVQAALEHCELNLNIFEPAMAKNMLDAIDMMATSITLLSDKCISGISANKERCTQLAEQSHPSKLQAAPLKG
jgi:aspartate ammonia-lyase